MHPRVREVIKQDWLIPIKVILHIDNILNELWTTLDTLDEKLKVAEMKAWFIVGFCTGLPGKEMLLIELARTALQLHLHFLFDADLLYFLLNFQGRTKSSQPAGSGFEMPCMAKTEGTGLEPGRWIKRLMDTLHA